MKFPRIAHLLAFGFLLMVLAAVFSSPSAAQIGIGISVRIGPPALPVYEQPICPGEGYLWTPGYWAWSDDDGYYWVPGTWVEAPEPGLLWTPGYWGWNDGVYAWNGGYWGPQIGFYGGINYGFGYGGNGFYGGEWRGGHFFYNTAVMHVDSTRITNVYVNRTVIVNNNTHVAFNGGHGGVSARPTPEQERYAHESHHPPVAAQVQHEHAASQDRALRASNNHGRPAVAATARPGEFSGHGVVAAKAAGGAYHAPAMSPKAARATAPAGNHAGENRSVGNKSAGNRPAGAHASSPSGTKVAKRPSATSNKSTAANRPEKANTAHGNTARPNETHAAKASPAPASHATKAPRTETAHPAAEPHAASKPKPAPRESAAKASAPKPAPRESAPRASAPKPAPRESAPRASAPKPAPRESAPKASAPKPAPRESAPKASAPRETHSAPPPQKQAAPPKHESAPPPKEHKGG